MQFPTLLITLITLLLTSPVFSAAIFARDNACTACLAMIQKADSIPQILDPEVCPDEKTDIMHKQVCSTLTTTPLFPFCEEYVDAWAPELFDFLATNSSVPQVVCTQPQFRAC